MRQFALCSGCAYVLLLLVACGGTGEALQVQVKAGESAFEDQPDAPVTLKVAVRPFQDGRAETGRLGTRISVWGTEQEFQLAEGQPGFVAASVMSDLMKEAGWDAEVVSPDGDVSDVDVVVTGKIEELSVDAIGEAFYTGMIVRSRVRVEAFNTADESSIRMILTGGGTQDVFSFDAEDAQKLLNDVLTDSFSKFVSSTTVEGQMLRCPSCVPAVR